MSETASLCNFLERLDGLPDQQWPDRCTAIATAVSKTGGVFECECQSAIPGRMLGRWSICLHGVHARSHDLESAIADWISTARKRCAEDAP